MTEKISKNVIIDEEFKSVLDKMQNSNFFIAKEFATKVKSFVPVRVIMGVAVSERKIDEWGNVYFNRMQKRILNGGYSVALQTVTTKKAIDGSDNDYVTTLGTLVVKGNSATLTEMGDSYKFDIKKSGISKIKQEKEIQI